MKNKNYIDKGNIQDLQSIESCDIDNIDNIINNIETILILRYHDINNIVTSLSVRSNSHFASFAPPQVGYFKCRHAVGTHRQGATHIRCETHISRSIGTALSWKQFKFSICARTGGHLTRETVQLASSVRFETRNVSRNIKLFILFLMIYSRICLVKASLKCSILDFSDAFKLCRKVISSKAYQPD